MSSIMSGLAGALGGGGGGGYDPSSDPSAGAAPPDDTAQGGDQYSTSLDALDGAEQALHAFIQLDSDEGDRAVAAQCLQNILKLKASNQQDQQSGGMKSLQRVLQGAGPGQGTAG